MARFEGRLDGEGDPAGTAVSGDWAAGEAAQALSQVVLADQSTLAARLEQEGIPEMDQWIQGDGPDPVPRALLRLLADSAARGERLADQPPIVMFWLPGTPPREVWDGPATLAKIIGLQIKLFYEADGMKVVTFDP